MKTSPRFPVDLMVPSWRGTGSCCESWILIGAPQLLKISARDCKVCGVFIVWSLSVSRNSQTNTRYRYYSIGETIRKKQSRESNQFCSYCPLQSEGTSILWLDATVARRHCLWVSGISRVDVVVFAPRSRRYSRAVL